MKLYNTIVITAFAAIATLTLASCGNRNANNQSQQSPAETEAAAVLEIDDLLSSAETLVDQPVTVEGICTHTCAHGARKIFLMGSDDSKTIRVESGQMGKAFDQKCVNNIVRVKGTLREERIDEAYLRNWEAQVAAQTAEQHGNGEAGCDTEKAARGETANTTTALVAYSDFRQQKKTVTAGKKANDYAFVLPDSHGQPIFSSYLDFHRHSRPTTLRSYSNYQKSYHRVNVNMKPAGGLFCCAFILSQIFLKINVMCHNFTVPK